MTNEQLAETTVTLERMKLIAQRYISRRLVEDFAISADIEVFGDVVLDDLIFQIRQTVMGCEMEVVECRYPADWWQALKKRYHEHYVSLTRWDRPFTVTDC